MFVKTRKKHFKHKICSKFLAPIDISLPVLKDVIIRLFNLFPLCVVPIITSVAAPGCDAGNINTIMSCLIIKINTVPATGNVTESSGTDPVAISSPSLMSRHHEI